MHALEKAYKNRILISNLMNLGIDMHACTFVVSGGFLLTKPSIRIKNETEGFGRD